MEPSLIARLFNTHKRVKPKMHKLYKKKVVENSKDLLKVLEYIEKIPVSCLDLVVPFCEEDLRALEKSIKAIRTREKERNYVMEIQRHYKLPLRPNESLKETMIRVRLKLLKERVKKNRKKLSLEPGSFPIDPLE